MYGRPVNQFGYPYEQFPAEQPVFITPVQQQADGLVSTYFFVMIDSLKITCTVLDLSFKLFRH